MLVEDLTERITSGDSVTLSGPEQWLHLQVEDDSVLLRAGTSPANRFAEFRVEFRRGTDVVVSVNAAAGVVRLTAEHFRAAQEQHADQVAIIV